jgi:hypothetical protein
MAYARLSDGPSAAFLIKDLGTTCVMYDHARKLSGGFQEASTIAKSALMNQNGWPRQDCEPFVELGAMVAHACAVWTRSIAAADSPPIDVFTFFDARPIQGAAVSHLGWESSPRMEPVALPDELEGLNSINQMIFRQIPEAS